MTYKGYLLSGKQFDESPENWQVNTATPDQMIKGLNYVIKFLNTGENTKIILPSYLAFGELGTGNIIPPYTPLLYEINIKNIVN
jgi:FKBP-type peptidyl-prolyl cis-trans isomerase